MRNSSRGKLIVVANVEIDAIVFGDADFLCVFLCQRLKHADDVAPLSVPIEFRKENHSTTTQSQSNKETTHKQQRNRAIEHSTFNRNNRFHSFTSIRFAARRQRMQLRVSLELNWQTVPNKLNSKRIRLALSIKLLQTITKNCEQMFVIRFLFRNLFRSHNQQIATKKQFEPKKHNKFLQYNKTNPKQLALCRENKITKKLIELPNSHNSISLSVRVTDACVRQQAHGDTWK